ncbi:MAG: hypothetical protein U0T77_10410 [Chitinophagales bacterium]
MKNLLKLRVILPFLILSISSISCKKADVNLPAEALAILPQRFANNLASNGFTFNTGNTPASIENIYLFEPINDYDNSGVFTEGQSAFDAKIKIANQSGSDADVFIYNWIVGVYDTSQANLIIGTGNSITVFAQATGKVGSITYKYDYVFSGTLMSLMASPRFEICICDGRQSGGAGCCGYRYPTYFHDKDALAAFTSFSDCQIRLKMNRLKFQTESKTIFLIKKCCITKSKRHLFGGVFFISVA